MRLINANAVPAIQSCLRCTRAGRTCPGYTLDSDLIFRNISAEQNPRPRIKANLVNFESDQIEEIAFRTFITDYCVSSTNPTVSRGYLNSLENLIEKAGPASDIAQSCNIIALANLGKKRASHNLMKKAQMLYLGFLPSFRLTIANEVTSVESLITAVLLGLYEVNLMS